MRSTRRVRPTCVAVILVNENGLTDQDEDTYRKIVENLRARTDIVVSMQDFISIERSARRCRAKTARPGTCRSASTAPWAPAPVKQAYRDAVKIIEETTAGTTLTPSIVGAAATMEDVTDIALRDQLPHRGLDGRHRAADLDHRLPQPRRDASYRC